MIVLITKIRHQWCDHQNTQCKHHPMSMSTHTHLWWPQRYSATQLPIKKNVRAMSSPTHEEGGGEVAEGALARFEQSHWVWPPVYWPTRPLQRLPLSHPLPAACPLCQLGEMLQLIGCGGNPHSGLFAAS